MKTIQDIIQKPSQAARAMIEGLQEHDKRDNSIVEMSEFFSSCHDICFACAATCAVQKVTGITLLPSFELKYLHNRSSLLNIDAHSLCDFELRMDKFREGFIESIFEFFEITLPDELARADWDMATDNWKQEIPKVQEWVDRAEKLGC